MAYLTSSWSDEMTYARASGFLSLDLHLKPARTQKLAS